MSKNPTTGKTTRIYDDNTPEFSKSRSGKPLYSDNFSGISGISGAITGLETSDSTTNQSLSSRTTSTLSTLTMNDPSESLWSTQDASYLHTSVLPSDASPFIFDGKFIHYNVERGVTYQTPTIIGSRKRVGFEGECGYHPSHLIFDPRMGTLAAGYDVDNGWSKLPYNSLITGMGNFSELNGSFISGSYNRIRYVPPPEGETGTCVEAPSCSIVGGSHNTISNSSSCDRHSAIVGCHNVKIENGDCVVALGMKGVSGDPPISGLSEAVITRNLHGLARVNAGPHNGTSLDPKIVFVANGDALVNNNLQSNGVVTKSITSDDLTVQNATIDNLVVSKSFNFPQPAAKYIEGTGGVTGSNFTILPTDDVGVVYVNPISGTLNISLGTGTNNIFPANKTITFKDVTLEYGAASSYNINILVSSPVRIEYYNNGLTVGTNAGYSLNSSGGSVTLRFSILPSAEGTNTATWVIQDQFIGNPRIISSSGLTFVPATDYNKSKLLKRPSVAL